MNTVIKFENFIKESEKFRLSDVQRFKAFLEDAKKMQKSAAQDFCNFLEKAEELKKLDLKTFNILKTLGVWRREVSHTHVISWLLNPDQSHGLKDIFLTKFFEIIGLGQLSLSNIVVKRFQKSKEGFEVDLTLENEDFFAIIENKITHKARKEQLATEFEKFNPNDGREFLPIYLTPFEKDKPHKDFRVITYREIEKILKILIRNCTNEDVKIFLRHYADTIREIALGKFKGFGEKSKLYAKYYDVISEFEREFKSDLRNLFRAIEDEIRQQEWFTRDWQIFVAGAFIQIFKNSWRNEKHNGIHFEIYYGKYEIKGKSMKIILHIEGNIKNKEQFAKQLYELSKEELKRLTDYTVRGKGVTFLIKEIKVDEKTIVDKITKELNRIVFLGKYIDKLLRKPEFS